MSVSATPSDQEVPALVPSSSTRDHLARFFSSRLYIVIISCVLLINIVLLGWQYAESRAAKIPNNAGYHVLSVLVNAVLISEVAMRVIMMGRTYCPSLSNTFDCLVSILSIFGLVFELSGAVSLLEHIEELLAIFLLIIRHAVVLMRIVSAVKNQTAWNNFAVIDLKALGPGYLDESKQMIRGESTEQYKTLYANPETYLDDGFRTEDEFADFPAD